MNPVLNTKIWKCLFTCLLCLVLGRSTAIDTSKVVLNVESISVENSIRICKVSLSIEDKAWKFAQAPNFLFAQSQDEIDVIESIQVNEQTYRSTLKIAGVIDWSNVNIRVNFPACSSEKCSFITKDFILNLSESVSESSDSNGISFLYIILLAVLGGIILNFMPCVLPVLMIKMRSFMKGSGRSHLLYTWIGIMFSFCVLAISICILKSLGHAVGWGMHFQNVYFLNFAALLLFVFILHAYERISFHVSVRNEGKRHNTFFADFFAGIIATLLSIPCTAPFLGTAATFALQGTYLELCLVFLAIGFGFGIPYFIAYFANVSFTLKPGKWMNIIKHIINGCIVITFLWVVWLLYHHLSVYQIGFLTFLYLLLFILSNKSLFFSLLVAVCICIMPVVIQNYEMGTINSTNHNKIGWMKFDSLRMRELIAEGKVIFVNITADWCMTCKYNESTLLKTNRFTELVTNNNVICMEGDLTFHNEEASLFLRMNNSSGIPFNMVFGPGAKTGIVLSVIPTIDEVKRAIEQAK